MKTEIQIIEHNKNKIIYTQLSDSFLLTSDTVLLTDFIDLSHNKNKIILDVGTGQGLIPLLLSTKTNNKIYGIEIQKEIADMATRSIKLNNLQEKFDILNCNITDIDKILKIDSYDAIVTNPPYKKPNSGKINENKTKLISRHEIEANLDDFIKISFKMLKDKGTLYMVHRAERLVDILSTMRKYKMEPKRIRFVYSNKNSESKLVLIEAIKNAKPFVKIEEPLYVYNENGEYTQEILKIYNKIK